MSRTSARFPIAWLRRGWICNVSQRALRFGLIRESAGVRRLRGKVFRRSSTGGCTRRFRNCGKRLLDDARIAMVIADGTERARVRFRC